MNPKENIFHQFPKERPKLPDEIAAIYKTYYKENREGRTAASSLAQRMEAWLHKQVATDVLSNMTNKSTLEIGAGTLNQLPYEPEGQTYDIVEPLAELYKDSALLNRIRNIYSDIAEIPMSQQYDRVTSIATFEHICNLPEVISRCGLLLKQKGSFRVSIPSEGTILWALGWRMTTGVEFRLKYGLDRGLFMKHEHVNTAREIEYLLRYFFEDVEGKVFGVSKSLSLYQFYACAKPNKAKCTEYLDSIRV